MALKRKWRLAYREHDSPWSRVQTKYLFLATYLRVGYTEKNDLEGVDVRPQ